MEKLTFDSGIREYQINGSGVLRFNPCDPNVYARLLDSLEDIKAVENDLVEKTREIPQEDGAAALRLMTDADKRMKEILNGVFGAGNDFEEIFGGVNFMAVCGNGERAITNLLNTLIPIVKDGAEKCAQAQVTNAVKEAKQARALRLK